MKTGTKCPTNQRKWNERAREMNCTVLQACTYVPSYHCVENEYYQIFVEVCAQAKLIHGFCPEFNIKGERIQDNYRVSCRNHTPPCPALFWSNEVYKYPSCFKLSKSKKTIQTQSETGTDRDIKGNNTNGDTIALAIIILTVLVYLLILMCWCLRKRIFESVLGQIGC